MNVPHYFSFLSKSAILSRYVRLCQAFIVSVDKIAV